MSMARDMHWIKLKDNQTPSGLFSTVTTVNRQVRTTARDGTFPSEEQNISHLKAFVEHVLSSGRKANMQLYEDCFS